MQPETVEDHLDFMAYIEALARLAGEDGEERFERVFVHLSMRLGRARHRVAFHWLSQPIRALFARSRPMMFKRP